jgi:disulfide bond formation protein DsbB
LVGATPQIVLARRLALVIPVFLIGGAYISEYVFGLYPCEMCWWQRYPHFAAIFLALVAGVSAVKLPWIKLAAAAIFISGLIGLWHAGVEYRWWEGVTACTSTARSGGDPLDAIMNAPLVRCDQVQWSLFGVSLAGWNFLFSTLGAITIMLLLRRQADAAS